MTTPNGLQVPSYGFPLIGVAASQLVIGRAAILRGAAFKESTGVAGASFDIIDGNDANGALIMPVTLNAGQSFRESYSSAMIVCQSGVFLRVNSGSVSGSLWLVSLSKADLAGLKQVHA